MQKSIKGRSRARQTVEHGQLGLNLAQTALALGISQMSVRRLVKRGLLKPSRALRTLVFARREIERFLPLGHRPGGPAMSAPVMNNSDRVANNAIVEVLEACLR